MRVFKSKIKKKYIDDLKNQISNGRIINWSPEKNKNAGLKFNDLKYILNYWKTKFDWEKQEEVLNKFNQYK